MATMMLEIPDALKSMFEPLRDLLRETEAQVDRGHALGREAEYESFEGRLVGMLVHPGERLREGQPIAWLRVH